MADRRRSRLHHPEFPRRRSPGTGDRGQAVNIAEMRPDDWFEVRSIYLEGIATGNATFQQTAPEWQQWDDGHLAVCRIVARSENANLGWAALSPVSKRPVYAGVAEVSVYVATHAR